MKVSFAYGVFMIWLEFSNQIWGTL